MMRRLPVRTLTTTGLKAEPVAYVLASIVAGLPGIAVQVVVIPLLLARGRLERSIADR
jgi:hypothetical protein